MFTRKILLCGVAALALFALAVTAGKGGGSKPPPPPPPPADPAILYHVSYGFPDDQVWVMNADGSNKTPIITLETHGVPALQPSWSGDSTRFVFAGRYYSSTQFALDVANLDGSGSTKRIHILPLGGGDGDPDWSAAPPPGQPEEDEWIFFSEYTGEADDLFAIRSDGTGLVNLTATEYRFERSPSVSLDGTFVVYTAVTYAADGGDGQRRVYKGTLNTDASGDPVITSETCLTDAGPLASADASPAVVIDPTGTNVLARRPAGGFTGEFWIIPLANPAGAWPTAIPSVRTSGGHAWLDDRTVVYTIYVANPRQFFLAKGDIHTGAETILDHLKTSVGWLGDPATRR